MQRITQTRDKLLDTGVTIIGLPLPRDNSIEIRFKHKLLPDEYDIVMQLLKLLRSSLVEEESDSEYHRTGSILRDVDQIAGRGER